MNLACGCQRVFGLKGGRANVLGVERDKVRVLTGDVGGSFGMKSAVYPEYLALFHAARALGRPVKGTDECSESFTSDSHGHDHEVTTELALDAQGNFLAVRVSGYGNLGAYVGRGTPIPPTPNAVKNTIGVYKTPLLEVATRLSSPILSRSAPIAASVGRKAITTWSAWSTPPAPRWASTRLSFADATTLPKARCRIKRRMARP